MILFKSSSHTMPITQLGLACIGKEAIDKGGSDNVTGGHNVIAGVLDYITERHPGSTLLGFKGGPGGILAKDYMEITQASMVSLSCEMLHLVRALQSARPAQAVKGGSALLWAHPLACVHAQAPEDHREHASSTGILSLPSACRLAISGGLSLPQEALEESPSSAVR